MLHQDAGRERRNEGEGGEVFMVAMLPVMNFLAHAHKDSSFGCGFFFPFLFSKCLTFQEQ